MKIIRVINFTLPDKESRKLARMAEASATTATAFVRHSVLEMIRDAVLVGPSKYKRGAK